MAGKGNRPGRMRLPLPASHHACQRQAPTIVSEV
jgi:hypothetical protein